MIDTIVLTLQNYTILDHDKFTPSTKNMAMHGFGSQSWIKYVQNPTVSEWKQGIRKPRLTITKRIVTGGIITPLKIEFSVPKLLFGNSFDESQESDFKPLFNLLMTRLKEMGVEVFKSQLARAKVVAIHFCKNIPFTDYTTVSSIIRELYKIDLTKKLDMNHRHYQDDGHALYYYSKSHSVIFYDKIQELKLPKGRAIEKDNALQLNLFDELNKKQLEIIRMEVRLCNTRKLKSIFTRLSIPEDLTFEAVFKQETAKKVLNLYWQDILDNLSFIRFATNQPIDLAETIIKKNGNINLKTALCHFGALTLINSVGSRRFRQLINESYSDRTWQRLKKNLKGLKSSPEGKYQPFLTITKVLDEFKPLKLADFDIDLKT
jgi:hypothetical protein